MESINLLMIYKIRDKIRVQRELANTEEATKQWFILPLINALGYNLHTTDVIPEYTLDIGIKKGEKVDYLLQKENKAMAIVECKQIDVKLGDKSISQLYRYFTVANVHLAILTNGDDYWFFTDSERENVMDYEPYLKIKLSMASNDEIAKLVDYAKQNISKHNEIRETMIQFRRYKERCKEFARELRSGSIPGWIVNSVLDEIGIYEIGVSNDELVRCLWEELFGVKENQVSRAEKSMYVENRRSINSDNVVEASADKGKSDIELYKEYVFNEGDWSFHKIAYAVIFGNRFDNISGRGVLLKVVELLILSERVTREQLLNAEEFKGTYKISEIRDNADARYIETCDIFVNTKFSIMSIVKFIEKLLDFAEVKYAGVKLAFRE